MLFDDQYLFGLKVRLIIVWPLNGNNLIVYVYEIFFF